MIFVCISTGGNEKLSAAFREVLLNACTIKTVICHRLPQKRIGARFIIKCFVLLKTVFKHNLKHLDFKTVGNRLQHKKVLLKGQTVGRSFQILDISKKENVNTNSPKTIYLLPVS